MATITIATNDMEHGEYEATFTTGLEDVGMSDPSRFGNTDKAPVRRWLAKLRIDACVECFGDEKVCQDKVGTVWSKYMSESADSRSTMAKLIKACGLNPKSFDTDAVEGKRIKFAFEEQDLNGKPVSVITTARPIKGGKQPRVVEPVDDDADEMPF